MDDGSTDGTNNVLRDWRDHAQFEVLQHQVNRGTGAAIRTALPHALGRFTIIQDADLEYDPEDYPRLIEPLLAGEARAVFGSRYLNETPPDPLWRRVANGVRTMTSRVRDAVTSLVGCMVEFPGWCAGAAWKALRGLRATDADISPAKPTASRVHHTQAPGSPARRSKQRLPHWGMRRFGPALLKLAARQLYGARLSDVSASLKALSTDLLRKLDLECERFEFGPEVAAKLCRTGEKIVEVPVHYERRVTRGSWIMERFGRRLAATGNRGVDQRPAVKKHRWNDGPRAAATLWRWRRWAPQIPDQDRIPAVTLAVAGQKSVSLDVTPAALGADIDHWAKEDASRSTFDEAAWNAGRRQAPAMALADGSAEAEPAMASSDARMAASSSSSTLSAATSVFEPRLMWERFVRKPSCAVSDDSDETDRGQDWEHWGLVDLMLLLAIVNIGLILLVTAVTPFSSWSGLLLAAIASAVTFRTSRSGKIRFDKCNRAFAILAVLLVWLMVPSSWIWRDRTMLLLAALTLLAGLVRLRSTGIKQLDRNLLDTICVLAFFFAGRHISSPDGRAIELLILLVSVTLFLGAHRRCKMRHATDNVLLDLSAIGIFFSVVFSYLFPLDLSRLSWRESWLRLRYAVLPHWTDFWWLRWGIVAVLAAMAAALLVSRARRSEL